LSNSKPAINMSAITEPVICDGGLLKVFNDELLIDHCVSL